MDTGLIEFVWKLLAAEKLLMASDRRLRLAPLLVFGCTCTREFKDQRWWCNAKGL